MPARKPIYKPVFLAEWLSHLRVSGAELARRMGRDKFYVSRIVTGKQPVTKEERDLLGAALGVPGDKLLEKPQRNSNLTVVSENGLSQEEKEADVSNLRPLARRLISKFGEPFIDAVLDEAVKPKPGETPRPRPLLRRRR